jgi:hypothetical protein
VLTAALALGALPGLAAPGTPRPIDPTPAGALQPLPNTSDARLPISIDGLDAAASAEGAVAQDASFVERGSAPKTGPKKRVAPGQPDATGGSVRKPPKSTLKGVATFYDEGLTAMRLPRGTVIIACGGGGCVERVVNDYGPQSTSRIIDLDKQDFFKICGCPSWSGTTTVTVYVY